MKTFIFCLFVFFSSIAMELPPSKFASLAQLCCKKIGEYPQENADNLFANAEVIEALFPENRSALKQALIATIDPQPMLLGTIPSYCRVKFSPDGKKIATLHNGITIHDADTGKELKRLSSDYSYFMVKWSPGSRYIVARKKGKIGNSKIGIWETDNEKPLCIFEIIVGGKCAFSSKDQYFFIKKHSEHSLNIYDPKNMHHLKSIVSVASKIPFQDPLGRYITAILAEHTSFYDAQTFEEKKQIKGYIETFSSDGEFFCIDRGLVTQLYNANNFEHIKDFGRGFLGLNTSIVHNKYFITASYDKDSLFDVNTGGKIASCKHNYPDSCNNAYISLDGTKIIELIYDSEKKVTVINIKKNNNELLHQISINTKAKRVSFSWDKKYCLLGDYFTPHVLINIVTGKLIGSYDNIWNNKYKPLKPSALFSSDGKYLIPKENVTEIWKLPSRGDLKKLPFSTMAAYCIFKNALQPQATECHESIEGLQIE